MRHSGTNLRPDCFRQTDRPVNGYDGEGQCCQYESVQNSVKTAGNFTELQRVILARVCHFVYSSASHFVYSNAKRNDANLTAQANAPIHLAPIYVFRTRCGETEQPQAGHGADDLRKKTGGDKRTP